MSICRASDDDAEIEYQQQTVVDTRIETGQPSLPSLPLLRSLNTANMKSDTCRETPSADFGSMIKFPQVFSLTKLIVSHDFLRSTVTNQIAFDQRDFQSISIFERTMDRCCQVLVSKSETLEPITFT